MGLSSATRQVVLDIGPAHQPTSKSIGVEGRGGNCNVAYGSKSSFIWAKTESVFRLSADIAVTAVERQSPDSMTRRPAGETEIA